MSDVVEGNGTIVSLPSLGADMDVGSVLEWRVAVGDHVDRGDVVALVSTDKSDIDVESWDTGEVTELIALIGVELDVGAPLLRLGGTAVGDTAVNDTAVDRTAAPVDTPAIHQAMAKQATPPPKDREPGSAASAHRTIASPMARRLAAERGLSIARIDGSGPYGAVIASDVEKILERPEPAAGSSPTPAEDTMRRAIAERMTRSNDEIPHYHLERDIDLGSALRWLEHHNADLPVAKRILPAALLASASARAARAIGRLNGTWRDGRFEVSPTVDLAMVISLRSGGMVTPTVVDADQLALDEMMGVMRDMVTQARKGKLRGRWMAPSSIAITNLGDNGADRVNGLIFPPHVALVGFGRISQRPWVVDGDVAVRPVVTASLAADHRASDGVDGSRFLASIADSLGHPESMMS